MKGYAKTVFQGRQVEEFPLVILGVLRNAFGPQQSIIWARLEDERLKQTGVFQGMSGSPVYVDGLLVGAVAYSFPFAKEPLAGITPIGEMIDIFKEKAEPKLLLSNYRTPQDLLRAGRFSVEDLPLLRARSFATPAGHAAWGEAGPAVPIANPLALGGFSPLSVGLFASHFAALGLVPVRGLSGTAPSTPDDEFPVEPGSSISVQLVRGDMEVSASGTVTYVQGNRIYAFGHPFLGIGYTDLPLTRSEVLTLVPSLMSSWKIAASGQPIGSIKQDRATGILGVQGAEARMLPVHLRLRTSRNELKDYRYEVVTDNFLTPFLMTFTVHNGIVSSERSIGSQTLQVRCVISLKGQPQVNFQNSVSDLTNSPVLAALTASAPVDFLLNSGFDEVEMEKVEIEIRAVEQAREAVLEKVWQDRLSVKPGEEVGIRVFLRKSNGEQLVEDYPIKIPEDIPAGNLQIMVGDGRSVSEEEILGEKQEFVPKNLRQLVKAINNLKKNDRLYVRLYREQAGALIAGEGLPDLPPSLLNLYNSRKTSGEVEPINRVVYVEHELPATDFVLQGRKIIQIKVKSG